MLTHVDIPIYPGILSLISLKLNLVCKREKYMKIYLWKYIFGEIG